MDLDIGVIASQNSDAITSFSLHKIYKSATQLINYSVGYIFLYKKEGCDM